MYTEYAGRISYCISINYILQINDTKINALPWNLTLLYLPYQKKNEQNHYFFHTVLRLNQILYISYCCFKINILLCMQTNIFKNTSTCTCHFYKCKWQMIELKNLLVSHVWPFRLTINKHNMITLNAHIENNGVSFIP